MPRECDECDYAFTEEERTIDAQSMKIVTVEYNYCPECGGKLDDAEFR